MVEDDSKSVTHYTNESGEHRCACGHELWRVVAAEVLGTALLVLLTCLTGCSSGATVLHRALASGLVVAIIVQCFDHISGAHLNPTVTLASVVMGHVRATRAAAMAAAQLSGGVLGVAALWLLAPDPPPHSICVTVPREDLSVYKAVLIEAVISGTLALANCASWDSRNRYLLDSWPLRVGLLVTGMTLVAGELTGASMNPVRSFAPALWTWTWRKHWVYWAGPLIGAAVSAGAYRGVWRAPRASRPRAAPAPPSR